MKRPRGADRNELVRELRDEAPFVRHAWELGRMRRRLEADLKTILDGTVHSWMVPLRAGDPRVAHAQLDRQLQQKLRELGRYDDKGFIFGGERRIAFRPFLDESITAIREARHAVDQAFLHANFSSVLERSAFTHTPKTVDQDRGASTEEQWQEAWLQITYGRYPKAIACEAIDLDEHAYDERRRRPRKKAGGLSINDAELVEWLRVQIEQETRKVDDHRKYREHAAAIAATRGLRIPKAMRVPKFSKAIRKRLPSDCRFLDDDRTRWIARLRRQPKASHALWRKLIRLREEFLAAADAAFAMTAWFDENVNKPSAGQATENGTNLTNSTDS